MSSTPSPAPSPSPPPPAACHSPLLLPGASEVVSDSNCIISPWKAQLNPELMMVVEIGTLSQLGPPGERGGKEDGREGKEGWRGCWEQPCTIAASRNSVWVVGGGRVGPGHTGTLRLSFFLKKAFSSTLRHVHIFTLTPIYTRTHLHVPTAHLTMFSYHTDVHIQMSL